MGTVAQLLEQTQFTREWDGITFVLCRIETPDWLRVMGPQGFGLIRGAIQEDESQKIEQRYSELDLDKQQEIQREFLRLCMVSPRIGDVTDDDADTIRMDDLPAKYETLIMAAMLEESGVAAQVADFPESSEDDGEETPQ